MKYKILKLIFPILAGFLLLLIADLLFKGAIYRQIQKSQND